MCKFKIIGFLLLISFVSCQSHLKDERKKNKSHFEDSIKNVNWKRRSMRFSKDIDYEMGYFDRSRMKVEDHKPNFYRFLYGKFPPISEEGKIIVSDSVFEDIKFEKDIFINQDLTNRKRFFGCVFKKPFMTRGKFLDDLSFRDTEFKNYFSLGQEIHGDVHFYDCKFFRFSNFNNFYGVVSFDECSLFQYSKFMNAEFHDTTSFVNTHFHLVNFSYATFNSVTVFNKSTFNRLVSFDNCIFKKTLNIAGIKLTDSSSLSFDQSVLPDTIDFSFNEKIPTLVDFKTASFVDSSHYQIASDTYFRPHFISLYKTDISKIRLDYIHFRLIIDSARSLSQGPDLFGEKIKIPKDEAEAIYEALLDNFKKNGQVESYRLLDIEYQKYKIANSTMPYLIIFPQYWWNFGYSRQRVFAWMAAFLGIFTVFNFFCLDYLNGVYKLDRVNGIPTLRMSYSSRRLFLKRSWLSFFYTSALFFSLTLKIDEFEAKKVKGTIYIMFIYTVGIICLAYMANYILQK